MDNIDLSYMVKEAAAPGVGQVLRKIWRPFGNTAITAAKAKGDLAVGLKNARSMRTQHYNALQKSKADFSRIGAEKINVRQGMERATQKYSKPGFIEKHIGLGHNRRINKLDSSMVRGNSQLSNLNTQQRTAHMNSINSKRKYITAKQESLQVRMNAGDKYRNDMVGVKARNIGNTVAQAGIIGAGAAVALPKISNAMSGMGGQYRPVQSQGYGYR
jgi:hypothetical protein